MRATIVKPTEYQIPRDFIVTGYGVIYENSPTVPWSDKDEIGTLVATDDKHLADRIASMVQSVRLAHSDEKREYHQQKLDEELASYES